jgi:aromatic-L-amino-acid decarboxylase
MITTSPNPYSIVADMLASVVNQHVTRGDVCELGSRLEDRVTRWIGEFIGYPAAAGILTSGGSTANLIALTAARTKALGRDVRRRGLSGARLVAYASTEVHISIERALDVLGIGADNLKRLPTDGTFRMHPGRLESTIRADREAGLTPFAVIAQGGSVTTGAVDPLNEIASVCEEAQVWLHVDGAYGAPAARVDGAKGLFAGLAEADSVTVDPHKWLYVGYESGCLLVKGDRTLESSFGGDGVSYLRADTLTDAPRFHESRPGHVSRFPGAESLGHVCGIGRG